MTTTTEMVEAGSCWVLRTLDVRDDATVSLATAVRDYEDWLGTAIVREVESVDPVHVVFETATGLRLRLTGEQFLARWVPVAWLLPLTGDQESLRRSFVYEQVALLGRAGR